MPKQPAPPRPKGSFAARLQTTISEVCAKFAVGPETSRGLTLHLALEFAPNSRFTELRRAGLFPEVSYFLLRSFGALDVGPAGRVSRVIDHLGTSNAACAT